MEEDVEDAVELDSDGNGLQLLAADKGGDCRCRPVVLIRGGEGGPDCFRATLPSEPEPVLNTGAGNGLFNSCDFAAETLLGFVDGGSSVGLVTWNRGLGRADDVTETEVDFGRV